MAGLALMWTALGHAKDQEEKNQLNLEEIRIFELLPSLDAIPVVQPYLPAGFQLGKQQSDPTFTQGYYWGYAADLAAYFADTSMLKGCVIHAKLSSDVSQVGFERFSDDQYLVHRLAAKGLTEIRVNRGKWGIFPFRELEAKTPKGKRHYKLWVGLNTEDGQTLEFILLYPRYLQELTQSQKQLWKNFIQKTKLLDLPYLLLAQKRVGERRSQKEAKGPFPLRMTVEKRRGDHLVLVRIAHTSSPIEVLSLEEVPLLSATALTKAYVNVRYRTQSARGEVVEGVTRGGYRVVDDFSFSAQEALAPTFEGHRWLLITSLSALPTCID